MTVDLLPQAVRDLDAITEPLYSRVLKRLRLPETTPAMGPPMLGPFAGYRSTVVGLFRVVYRVVAPDRVEVAYLRHCRRAPPG